MVVVDDKTLLTLFPSMLFKGKISDSSFIDGLEKKIRNLKTNNIGSLEKDSFVSDDMLQNRPEFKELSDLILAETAGVLDYFTAVRDSHYISNMWANITSPNHEHMMHIHPNSFLSGILYIKTPQDCGPTSFADPRPAARIIEPDYKQYGPTNSGVFTNKPEKGGLLIWNSYLPHGVQKGSCKQNEDRIVVAFNIMLKGKISQKKTAYLEL